MTKNLIKKSESLIRFGLYLNQLRNNYGFSIQQLSARVGINVRYISLIERGLREPSDEDIVNIAEFFKLDEDYLFNLLGRLPLKVYQEVERNTTLQKTIKEINTSDCSPQIKEDIYLQFYKLWKVFEKCQPK